MEDHIPVKTFDHDIPVTSREQGLYFHIIERDYSLLHTHTYWEFFVILKGAVTHHINDKSYRMDQYDACLLKPSCRHSLKKCTDTVQHLNIVIEESLLKSVACGISDDIFDKLNGFENGINIRLDQAEYEIILHYLSILRSGIATGVSSTKNFPERLLIADILEIIVRKTFLKNSTYPNWLNAIMLYANNSLNMEVGIEQLVRLSNYSYSHLERLFKQHTGQSLNKYLSDVKMKNACDLLVHTQKSILDISLDLVFSSVSHFIKVFKSNYNTTPAKYRKQHG